MPGRRGPRQRNITAGPAGGPDQASSNRLREHLSERLGNGSIPVRKALFGALIEHIEVKEPDDIRPTFHLHDPMSIDILESQTDTDVTSEGA